MFILFVVAIFAIQTIETYGQKRTLVRRNPTVTKPNPEPTPKPVVVSPAQALFNDGLKCEAKDYDCQISNFIKAINLDLKTKERKKFQE